MGKQHTRVPLSALRDPGDALALGLGSGLVPAAPGTFGTLATVPLYWLMQPMPLWVYLGITVLFFMVGIWLCDRCARHLGVHDHPAIVWDEVVGYLITMAAAPAGGLWLLIGFALFRFFDIVKPWPIRWADRKVSGGFGIMLDDVLAGVYAWCGLQMIAWLMLG